MSNTRQKRTSKEKGDAFEQEVADLFQCMPSVKVTQHVKLSGKDVDILVEVTSPVAGITRIAVDAKDYSKPLTRREVTDELSDYLWLLGNGDVHQILLVTRNSIVANAKELFDGQTKVHMLVQELQKRIVDPSQLLLDSEECFLSDGLDKYYVETKVFDIDMDAAQQHYDLLFNEFITSDYTLFSGTFLEAKKAWLAVKGDRYQSICDQYNDQTFKEMLGITQRRKQKVALEPIITKWLNSQTRIHGIALLGTYGTGKSSFARRIAHVAASLYKSGASSRIPLMIELRNFGSHQSIEGLITHTLVNKHGYTNGSFHLFKRMNLQGRYFLILDGFDEMKQGMTRDALAYNFNELNSLCVPNAKVLLCGRPTMFANEEEKSAILSGASGHDFTNQGKYIPVEIAPLDTGDILAMIEAYVALKFPEHHSSVSQKVLEIRDEIKNNEEFLELLSRPVHVPMFLTILPEFPGAVTRISRGLLYERFIDLTISREVNRLPPAYQGRYSTSDRFQFAGALALEIARRGESRSIRWSEIPATLLTPFVKTGENEDIALRDLVMACFLERKQPDILSFGHKSFLEFLIAKFSLEAIRGRNEASGGLIYPSREIADFTIDLMVESDISRLAESPIEAREFIICCLAAPLETIRLSEYITKTNRLGRDSRSRIHVLRVLIDEKVRKLIAVLCRVDVLRELSRISWTSGCADKLILIMAIQNFALESSTQSPAPVVAVAGFSDEVWGALEEIASKGTASDIVKALRRAASEEDSLASFASIHWTPTVGGKGRKSVSAGPLFKFVESQRVYGSPLKRIEIDGAVG